MKTTKRLSAAILVLALTLCASSAFAADTPSPWAEAEISPALLSSCTEAGVGGDFTAPVTKASMAKILLSAYLNGGISFEISVQNPFADLSDPLVLTACAIGLIDGESETEFAPDKTVTRLEAVRCVYAAANEVYYFSDEDRADFCDYAATLQTYTDLSPAESDLEALGFALYYGVLRGTSDTSLELSAPCTLEQALVFVSRGVFDD